MLLEPRQLSTLNEMGIPVWELRSQQSENISPVVEITSVELDKDLLQRDWLILVDQYSINEQEQRLLYAMLLSIGLSQQHIAVVAAEQLLQLQQVPAKQKLLFAFGRKNAQLLLGEKTSLDESRGKVHQALPSEFTTVVSFSLKELLEFPERKVLAWQDLQFAKSTYEQGL